MSKKILASTFSVKMLASGGMVKVTPVDINEVINQTYDLISAGHQGTAELFSTLLGQTVDVDRTPIALETGDTLYAVMPNFRVNPGQELNKEELEGKLSIYKVEVL